MSKSPQQRIDELEKQAADMQTELQQLRDLLPLEQTSNPWEDGTIYRLARQWVVDNPDKRASSVYQNKDGDVWICYNQKPDPHHWFSIRKLGDFPEHPAGWRNSATPLPPVPPVETWPEGYASIELPTDPDGDYLFRYSYRDLIFDYCPYPKALCEAWQFTRTELEAKP